MEMKHKYNPQIRHRRSIRLIGYDYSQPCLYFITICCQNRACLFGEVINGKMVLNDAGKMVENEWLKNYGSAIITKILSVTNNPITPFRVTSSTIRQNGMMINFLLNKQQRAILLSQHLLIMQINDVFV